MSAMILSMCLGIGPPTVDGEVELALIEIDIGQLDIRDHAAQCWVTAKGLGCGEGRIFTFDRETKLFICGEPYAWRVPPDGEWWHWPDSMPMHKVKARIHGGRLVEVHSWESRKW